jgi:NDP-sugar pyrophosphorylase family protein
MGSRLRPLTDRLPKCMVALAGKPVLQWNIEWLRSQGVTQVVVNLHHHPQIVKGYFGDGSDFGVAIRYSFEPQLMGTAGAVWAARSFLEPDPFFVLYGDNLINCDLKSFMDRHERQGALLTMALFWRRDLGASGVVRLDGQGRITAFKEKPGPGEVLSHWVNAGLFLCEPPVMTYIPSQRPSDFGHDVLPAMLAAGASLYGYTMGPKETLCWIDTPEDLAHAQFFLRRENRP